MGYDLHSGLRQYTADPVVSPTGIDTPSVAARVRHRRTVRAATTAVASTAAAVLAGTAFGLAHLPTTDPEPVAPAVTSTPSPSPSTTSEPAPSPTAAPTPDPEPTQAPVSVAPPVREPDIDDATVLARQREPRTGEVWIAPERAPEMQAVLAPDERSSVWRVGQRDASTIYLVVQDHDVMTGGTGVVGVAVAGLYEVDDAGVREVVCPSARTGDACVAEEMVPLDVAQDETTFYDTLTLPRSIDLAAGWRLTTTATTSPSFFGQRLLGDVGGLYGVGGTTQVVADLGATQVVEVTREGEVAGLNDVRYAIRTPYGATIDVSANDSPSGEFGLIHWDDAIDRPLPDWAGVQGRATVQSSAPGSDACFSGTFSVEDRHVPGDWRPAGTTPGGHRVYVPVPGGNSVSRTVRAWQAENSVWFGETAPDMQDGLMTYRYGTDEEFLADNALYAIQGPAGEWQLRLRIDAVQRVYEC
jgi:hypothetical protein